jgi:hypothetical protein
MHAHHPWDLQCYEDLYVYLLEAILIETMV